MRIREKCRPAPTPLANFPEYFQVLADLLRAYGEVTRRLPEWAESIIQEWNSELSDDEKDAGDTELEQPIKRVLLEYRQPPLQSDPPLIEEYEFRYHGVPGVLYKCSASNLLTGLQKLRIPGLPIPKNARGLSCRLHSCRFQEFKFFPGGVVPELKRTGNGRSIGFWRPMTQ
jgi:hypothetical protein